MVRIVGCKLGDQLKDYCETPGEADRSLDQGNSLWMHLEGRDSLSAGGVNVMETWKAGMVMVFLA